MIEVEKKFAPTKKQLNKLLTGAKLLEEIIFSDCYFDMSDYSLILSDRWLRLREGKPELKLPLGPIGHTDISVDLYDEVTDGVRIGKILKLPEEKDFKKALAKAGYKQVASFVTKRKKYKKKGFNIDVDEIDFGYRLIEIETLIKDRMGMDKASEKILNFAKSSGLTVSYVRGKFVEYIFRYNKNLYREMKKAGFFPQS